MSNKEKSIHNFEASYHNQNDQYSVQPMLNNWRESKEKKPIDDNEYATQEICIYTAIAERKGNK